MPTYTNATGATAIVPNLAGNNVVVDPGESIQTLQILGDGWTKTSDEPFDRLTLVRETVSAGGHVSGLLPCPVIVCTASQAGIIACPNSTSNPGGFELPAGFPVEIDNSGTIEALYLVGSSGTVLVQGLR
jgi:hypothetical protein